MRFLPTLSLLLPSVLCDDVLYDGRAKPDFNAGTLDNNSGPYLAYAFLLFREAPNNSSYG